ncbi:hypothetical protein BBF96_12720 [Anoxybacter fermentans]|uniref:Prephenate dehydrogenase n=1 Tax=Anoxybacter fermentans TaxID=1323375 RepID=A0A3Q9HRM6_9FIRM|nr:prephenate dehydrogenase/arogenate dehydrogenase family protein [Anoxybacter fermentans]AZR74183.1 hypothetical protein BBF96_12720 [Anoxybacter fermentans]
MEVINQMTVVGVGLIGGSLARAFRKQRLCKTIVGVDINAEVIKKALQFKVIDQGTLDLKEGVRDADLIILAVPVGVIGTVLKEIKTYIKQSAWILDVGSTKSDIIKQAEEYLKDRPDLVFVGGHPMAGSEKAGVEWSDPYLFQGAPFILIPLAKNPRSEVLQLSQWLERIGARVVIMDHEQHDLQVGYVSHLPHLVAAALVNVLSRNFTNINEVLSLSGGGFKDTTRIAASQPNIWIDIFSSNRQKLKKILDHFLEELIEVKKMLSRDDREGLFEYFSKARQIRTEFFEEEK